MNADELARALGFKRSGNQWAGCCVAHDDRNPSMIIFDGRNGSAQVRCLSGCQSIDIIDALRERGVWKGNGHAEPDDDAARIERDRQIEAKREANRRLALHIWIELIDAHNTIAQAYLNQRGLELPAGKELIRYHRQCPLKDGVAPALVAVMRDLETNDIVGINRLFLETNPYGLVKKIKGMMLGRAGGAAMMLSDWDEIFYGRPAGRLLVCEGLETGLAIKANHPERAVWALGSAGAIASSPIVPGVGHLVICADNDADNIDSGFMAAVDCAKRWNESARATILMPDRPGADFADVPIEV